MLVALYGITTAINAVKYAVCCVDAECGRIISKIDF